MPSRARIPARLPCLPVSDAFLGLDAGRDLVTEPRFLLLSRDCQGAVLTLFQSRDCQGAVFTLFQSRDCQGAVPPRRRGAGRLPDGRGSVTTQPLLNSRGSVTPVAGQSQHDRSLQSRLRHNTTAPYSRGSVTPVAAGSQHDRSLQSRLRHTRRGSVTLVAAPSHRQAAPRASTSMWALPRSHALEIISIHFHKHLPAAPRGEPCAAGRQCGQVEARPLLVAACTFVRY